MSAWEKRLGTELGIEREREKEVFVVRRYRGQISPRDILEKLGKRTKKCGRIRDKCRSHGARKKHVLSSTERNVFFLSPEEADVSLVFIYDFFVIPPLYDYSSRDNLIDSFCSRRNSPAATYLVRPVLSSALVHATEPLSSHRSRDPGDPRNKETGRKREAQGSPRRESDVSVFSRDELSTTRERAPPGLIKARYNCVEACILSAHCRTERERERGGEGGGE